VLRCSHLGEKPGASFPPGGDTRYFVAVSLLPCICLAGLRTGALASAIIKHILGRKEEMRVR
jgi:hypothetical protein